MTTPIAGRLAALLLLAPAGLVGQAATTLARTGATFESYSFGTGLAFNRVSELTIPFGVSQRVGNRFVIDLSSAYASASVSDASGGTITHSGLIDTDVRATINLVPGKFVFNVVGTIPTGATAVPEATIPLFGALATDLLGFTTPNFGSGGGISTGFASAFRVGQNWAFGTGASYRYAASYVPVQGPNEMMPGGEIRGRLGLEGPFGGGKYFRGALVYSVSGANDLGDSSQSVIGDRFLAYASVSMPMGRSLLTMYGWDMRRLRARDYDTPNTVAVPRGNLFALGGRIDRPMGPKAVLSPLIEFRHELTGPGPSMELLGYLLRAGSDLRYHLTSRATAVLQAQIAFGTLHDEGTSVSMVGPRLSALIEWAR